MNYRQLLLLSLFTIIFLQMEAVAQRVQPNRWLLKADGGISVFFGDVKRYDYVPDFENPSEIKPMFSASLGKEISRVFSVRGQFLYGQLSGHKKSAHYNFKADLMGGQILTDINLVYLLTKARFGTSKLNIYASLGAGYLTWNSLLYYDHPPKGADDLMASSKTGSISFPFALSAEYVLSKHFSLNIEGLLYVVASDDVDAKPGGIKTDMINYNNIGITYKMINKKKAKRTRIKYRLDPQLYETLPTVKEDDQQIVQEPADEVPVEVEEKTELAKQEEQTQQEEKIQQEDSDLYKIDHELEKEAIQKEVWASKTDDPWPQINFSVQILASKSLYDTEKMQKDLDLPEKIFVKFDGEWYRYSVGNYDKMWRAKELRNGLRSKEDIKDAFIVVYRNDERISLEEALNYAARKQVIPTKEFEIQDRAAAKVYPLVKLEDNIPQTGITIGVQVISIRNDYYPLGVFKGIYGIDNNIHIYEQAPWMKIIVTGFSSFEEAYDYQFIARDKGFIDAFVVAFKDGKRISINKLKEELAR